jgi:hypothetical protein
LGNPTQHPAGVTSSSAGHSKPLDIAREIIQQVPDASFGLRIIGKDYDQNGLNYRYTVDLSSTPGVYVKRRCRDTN